MWRVAIGEPRIEAADEEGSKVVREAALTVDGRQVDVVVARHDAHLRRARHFVEQGARRFVLALERQVRDVAGDDDMVGLGDGSRQDGPQVVAAVHTAAVQEQVRVSGDALVEEHAPPLEASRREHMQVRQMGNAKQLAQASLRIPDRETSLLSSRSHSTELPAIMQISQTI